MLARIMVTLSAVMGVIGLSSCAGHAQDVVVKGSAYDCHRYVSEAEDPVSSRLRQVLDCYSGGLIAISQEVPADKYTGQKILGATWGHNVGHVAFISAFACSKLSGEAEPRPPRRKGWHGGVP